MAECQPLSEGRSQDSGDLCHLNERLDEVTAEIETLAKADPACQRLMTVPGIGPIIASAMVSAVGDGAAFGKGRDFAAWLGLVPRQMSTGGRTILGRISKRGNTYLRTLFIRGARVILLRPENWPKPSFGPWLQAASRRLHRNVLAVALANKLARIAWSVLAGKRGPPLFLRTCFHAVLRFSRSHTSSINCSAKAGLSGSGAAMGGSTPW